LVDEQDLQAGNSIIMGVTQLAGFVGPTIAGIIIARFSDVSSGVGTAFAFDAFTFVVSAVTLQLIQVKSQTISNAAASAKESVWESMKAGVRYLWDDRPMRFMFSFMMGINFLLIGPIMVGIPLLADQRLPEGATAFGLLMSAFAGGSLLGYILAGVLPRPDSTKLRLLLVAVLAGFGIVIGSFGFITSTWVDVALLLFLSMCNGFNVVLLMTWMQTRTPKDMLGRIMALLMFASTGLAPISQAISGLLSKWDLTMMFAIPGALVLLLTVWVAFHPDLKTFSESLASTQAKS
jgi:MFS family permease